MAPIKEFNVDGVEDVPDAAPDEHEADDNCHVVDQVFQCQWLFAFTDRKHR